MCNRFLYISRWWNFKNLASQVILRAVELPICRRGSRRFDDVGYEAIFTIMLINQSLRRNITYMEGSLHIFWAGFSVLGGVLRPSTHVDPFVYGRC